MLNIGIENIQPKVSIETEMSIEELIDFATAIGVYSDEINQDFKVLDQHILAVENLISVLDNLKEHGKTSALEALIGNQIELSDISLEGMIGDAVKKVIDFIKGLIKKIKEFFTNSTADKVAEEISKTAENDSNKKYNIKALVSCVTGTIDERSRTVVNFEKSLDDMVNDITKGLNDDKIIIGSGAGTPISAYMTAVSVETYSLTIGECKTVAKTTIDLFKKHKQYIQKFEDLLSKLEARSKSEKILRSNEIKGVKDVLEAFSIGTKRATLSLLSIRKALHGGSQNEIDSINEKHGD